MIDLVTHDTVIIGSGFGGSVATMHLTEKGSQVLVLERGRRYHQPRIIARQLHPVGRETAYSRFAPYTARCSRW